MIDLLFVLLIFAAGVCCGAIAMARCTRAYLRQLSKRLYELEMVAGLSPLPYDGSRPPPSTTQWTPATQWKRRR